MSDGSHILTVRDPQTFEVIRRLEIWLDDVPMRNLNELECAGDSIYANIWFSDQLLRIDKHSGRVSAIIEAANLLTPEERAAAGGSAVLNGIAYEPVSGRFFLTGKLWPWLFEVEFVPELPETYRTPTPLAP